MTRHESFRDFFPVIYFALVKYIKANVETSTSITISEEISLEISWYSDGLRPLEALCVPDPRQEVVTEIDKSTGSPRPRTIEDHFRTVEPLSLSIAVPAPTRILWNTARNLFVYSWFVWRFEPLAGKWGAPIKDQLENKLNQMVCDGQLPLVVAQQAFETNWIAAYQKYIGSN